MLLSNFEQKSQVSNTRDVKLTKPVRTNDLGISVCEFICLQAHPRCRKKFWCKTKIFSYTSFCLLASLTLPPLLFIIYVYGERISKCSRFWVYILSIINKQIIPLYNINVDYTSVQYSLVPLKCWLLNKGQRNHNNEVFRVILRLTPRTFGTHSRSLWNVYYVFGLGMKLIGMVGVNIYE